MLILHTLAHLQIAASLCAQKPFSFNRQLSSHSSIFTSTIITSNMISSSLFVPISIALSCASTDAFSASTPAFHQLPLKHTSQDTRRASTHLYAYLDISYELMEVTTTSDEHQMYQHRQTRDFPVEPLKWELGLIRHDDCKHSNEFISECLSQVVGISEEDANLVSSLARQHGVALIEEFPRKYAVMYQQELESRGIDCEMVPVEE
jgi:ATP-dependent Clp protease adapter protein ClpS